MVEDVVADGDAGGDEFGDAALDEFLCQLGVFELFADGDAFAGADEFWQIGVERVMGEAGELDVLRHAVGAPCQGDAENLRGGDGVVRECLVEVSDPEEQYGVGMF